MYRKCNRCNEYYDVTYITCNNCYPVGCKLIRVNYTNLDDYLHELITTLLTEKGSFDGKRPFGNSGWEYDIYKIMIQDKLIEGSLDSDGFVCDINTEKADEIVLKRINYLFGRTSL